LAFSSSASAPRAAATTVEHLEPVEADVALGQGAGLVETDDVDPGQALDRGELLHQHLAPGERDRGDPEREAGQQDETLGHHADHRRHERDQGVVEVGLAQLAGEQHGRGREQGELDVAQQPVDAPDELGPGQREPPGLGGDGAGVGLGPDPGGLEAARPGHDDRAGQHLVAGPLVDRVGLTGQQRLVDLETGGDGDDAVGGHLVAGAHVDEVVEHHRFDRALDHGAVAHHPGEGGGEHGEAVEGALGPHLLDDPDGRVGHEDDPEERVPDVADREDDDEHRAEDGVEPGQYVRPDDLAVGAAGAIAGVVGVTTGDPFGDLGGGEARTPRDHLGSGRAEARGGGGPHRWPPAQAGPSPVATGTSSISPVASSSSRW
jgi:hypothetical protein